MNQTAREVVIIGGGLSGLAAAYELEQHGISYTLIEVKPRLGGSVLTQKQGDFVMDGGTFAFPDQTDRQTCRDLGLADALFSVDAPYDPQPRVAFKQGTMSLVDALVARLTNPIIQRMAVTGIAANIGSYRFRICLENGLALDTNAVIVAASARYAERMLRSLAPDVSKRLRGYYYDDVTRVALGYTAENRPEAPQPILPDMVFASLSSTAHPSRVPDGGLLIQAAIRVPLTKVNPKKLLESITTEMGWNPPDASLVHHWHESDPLNVRVPANQLAAIGDDLPDGVALIGSCYQHLSLLQRVENGRETARLIIATLPDKP